MRDFWHWRPGGPAAQPPSGEASQPSLPPLPPLPPVSAEYESTVASAQPGATPQQFPWKLSRSGDGKVRLDHGGKSVINDPIQRESITLDHVKKEAMTVPAMAVPQQPQTGQTAMPEGGQAPSPPGAPNVKDLGTKLIAEHEAEGKLYTFQPPVLPQPPTAPQPPQPAVPQLQKPQTVEVWTSKKLGLPLLTKSSGPGGEQMDACKKVSVGEPPPSVFQVPQGYKMVKAPDVPAPPMH